MRAIRLTAAAQEALRPRARAQVAENERAVRTRVAQWRGQDHAASETRCEPRGTGPEGCTPWMQARIAPPLPLPAVDPDDSGLAAGNRPATAAPDVVTDPGWRVRTPGRLSRSRLRAFAIDNWPLVVLVVFVLAVFVLAVSVHTFVPLRVVARFLAALFVLGVPVGLGFALHGLVEGRWPVIRRRR